MKKFLALTLGLLCATALVVQAQDAAPKTKLTPEQKALRKELLAKYDANKNGKLDPDELAKMSQADKDAMTKASLDLTKGGKKKKNADAGADAAPAAPAPAK
jgi:Ca2+-binding EF-hand superfamily protein